MSVVVNKNESLLKWFETDLSKVGNLLSAKNMNTGFVASTHIEKVTEKDMISKTMVANFYEKCECIYHRYCE